jgi:cAMP phosphodiesterase
VRSTATGWKKGCLLAVDAGVHLSSITKMLENHKSISESGDMITAEKTTLIDGPFEGLEIPYKSAKANAAHITRALVDTYLITHPHLDHISGFVVNTAALPGLRPKRLAGLPFTIEAFKNHIFNNVIWPNLSDENNGAGLVTYMRLIEGGSPALGDGESKGYAEVCEGLGVKVWSVSHGHCIEHHSHRGSSASPFAPDVSPRSNPSLLSTGRPRAGRSSSTASFPGSIGGNEKSEPRLCVYDSSTYFIRDFLTGREVVIFGDVEADSLSLSPRNKRIWTEAAPKIVHGYLTGIFIECSYDDSREVDSLYGHLAPRFLIEELKVLAAEVREVRERERTNMLKKRKRPTSSGGTPRRKQPSRNGSRKQDSPRIEFQVMDPEQSDYKQEGFASSPESERTTPTTPGISRSTPAEDDLPLKGVRVIAIHIKDKLDDGPDIGDIILEQLNAYETQLGLGCEFVIARTGQALYF